MTTNHSVHLSDKEVITIRKTKASIEEVFIAWTDPIHLANWWGPKGFSNTFHEFQLSEGGKWIFTMHSEMGIDYPNECVFIKMERPHFISWHHISKPEFIIEASFSVLSSSETEVSFKMIFPTAEDCSRLKDFVSEKNEENMDRLEMELLTIRAKS